MAEPRRAAARRIGGAVQDELQACNFLVSTEVAREIAYGKGNRGFAQGLAGGGGPPPPVAPPAAADGLARRIVRTASRELAAGNAVTRVHELVDPARVPDLGGAQPRLRGARREHLRRPDRELQGARAPGSPGDRAPGARGTIPSMTARSSVARAGTGRRVLDAGARTSRTSGSSSSRANLTDEEAFRVADLENRSRA